MSPSSLPSDAAPPGAAQHRALWWLAAAMVLLAFNLRLIFPSLSVLLPEILRATGLSATGATYLTTLPILCMGAFAPLAPWCARRFGTERTLLGVLVLMAIGTVLRGWHGAAGLFLGSALAGGAIAIANVLLPALVKRDFVRHVAGMTALYTMSLNAGASVAAAATLPLTHAFGSAWPAGVAAWGALPIVAALIWAAATRRARGPDPGAPAPPRGGVWRSPLAWQVTFFMGLQSAMAYCVSGWLAPILRARGLDGTTAGLVTSVCILMNAVGSLAMPPVLARFRDQRWVNVALSVLTGAPLVALLFAPLSQVWVWAIVQGLGQGGMFATALTVIALRAPDTRSVASLSSMAQTIGYLLAAGGPLVVGLLFSATGDFAASGWLFVAVMTGAGIAGFGAGRALFIHPHDAGGRTPPLARTAR
ncbi:MAG TPA: MFS transporter [Rhodanobacteraceae bacterium]|nr:MFS transporter [Rhodanobacteraceae bacterium]